MMEGYRNWKEQTTTSPSGRHLGHYHALYRPFKYDEIKKEENEKIERLQGIIIRLHHIMLQIAVKHKHVYKRWNTVVTQMIEKDPGSPKLHRLRVINLYDCDFNLLLKIYFRQFSRHCEDTNQLNEGSYCE